MSDYEGEWEPAEKRNRPQIPDSTSSRHIGHIAPRGKDFATAVRPHYAKSRVKDRTETRRRQILSPSYRPELQGRRVNENGIADQGKLHSRGQQDHIESRVGELASFRKFQDNRETPGGSYETMYSWKDFVRASMNNDGIHPQVAAVNRLAQICINTQAFVEVPKTPETHSFLLWGTPEQIETAKKELQALETHMHGPGARIKNGPWVKTGALDGRFEYRQIQDQNRQSDFLVLQESVLVTDLPCQAQLIWPDGYDLEGFIAEYDNDIINNLRYQFKCHIVHEQNARITLVGAYNIEEMYAAYNRLLNLSREMIMRKKKAVRITLCYLPGAKSYRERVKLAAIGVVGEKVSLPQLAGATLPPNEVSDWTELRTQRTKGHRKIFKANLSSCIAGLQFSQKHVRMRVTFGDIGLLRYKKATTSSEDYAIDEFVPMVQSPEIEVRQCPLRSEFSAAENMLNKISTFEEFSDPVYSWAVHFDFQGTQGATNNILRLETEFQSSVVSPNEELERHTIRWLQFRSNQTYDTEKLLELNAIDFEKIGFQFQVNAVSLFKNDKILDDLRNFEDKIQFRPPPHGLQYAPSKRSTFPVGQKELRSVREISIARYRFKDTDGIFEMRRIDIFPQRPGDACAEPLWTEWTAAYYYRGWDNLTAEFAYNKDGEDVKWERNLATFFPRNTDPNDPKSLPKGFKTFLKEVEQIQILLAEATGKKQPNLMDIDDWQ